MEFNNLPVEIIEEIFSYLSQRELYINVRLVCKSWETLSFCPRLWQSVNMKLLTNGQDETLCRSDALEIITAVAKSVTSLTCDHIIRGGPMNILDKTEFPNLKKLTVFMRWHEHIPDTLNVNVLDKLVARFQNLKEIRISVLMPLTDFTDEGTEHLRKLDSIEYHIDDFLVVDCNGEEREFNEIFRQSINFLPNLTCLQGFQMIDYNSLATLLQKCTKLNEVKFFEGNYHNLQLKKGSITSSHLNSLTRLTLDLAQAEDRWIEALVINLPNLEHLNVGGGNGISDYGVALVAKYCPKLQSIDISRCKVELIGITTYITDEGMKAIANGCHLLRTLKANFNTQISDESLAALAQSCPNLEDIELKKTRISDKGLQSLVLGCPLLKCMIFDWCSNISVKSAKFVLENLRSIQVLSLGIKNSNSLLENPIQSDWLRLDYESLRHTSTHQGHSPLTEVCINVDDTCLKAIADACPDLKRVKLAPNDRLTDVGIEHLLRKCKLLTELNIDGKFCDRIRIEEGEVEHFEIRFTSNLTNKTLFSIVKFGHSLRRVNMQNNLNIDKAGLLVLLKQSLNLQQISLSVLNGRFNSPLNAPLNILTLKDCKEVASNLETSEWDEEIPRFDVIYDEIYENSEAFSDIFNVQMRVKKTRPMVSYIECKQPTEKGRKTVNWVQGCLLL